MIPLPIGCSISHDDADDGAPPSKALSRYWLKCDGVFGVWSLGLYWIRGGAREGGQSRRRPKSVVGGRPGGREWRREGASGLK